MSLFSSRPVRRAENPDGMTVIGPEAYFRGMIQARGSVRVEGEVEGNISEARAVIIGKRGRVLGDVTAQSVVVAGSLEGNVAASVQIELKAGARLSGDIRAPKLLVEEGAVFEGHCAMAESPKAKEALPA